MDLSVYPHRSLLWDAIPHGKGVYRKNLFQNVNVAVNVVSFGMDPAGLIVNGLYDIYR
jgi:hypothetical protein